jgi:RNA polymerase sigma-70 factor (ECF subfamily)
VVLHGEDADNEISRLASAHGDSFKEVSRSELSERLKQALEELTPEHRAVILLREVEGLSYDEISEVLQCPRGTVMSRLHYARDHLRGILKDVGGS